MNHFDPSSPLAARLLAVMDRKHHWAYPALTKPGLSRAQLLQHFRHEYLVYVRDFPVLLARALGQAPPIEEVRVKLAENLYEEQTGGISRTAPHPELFLRMMEGLGYTREDFADDDAWLHPDARAYRDFLRETSVGAPWQAAVAVLTVFVEGSVNERRELAGGAARGPRDPADDAIAKHPVVIHYGCPPAAMQLARAHAAVEGGHRGDAWAMVLGHTHGEAEAAAIDACERALVMWHRYRDGVAERMGLARVDAA